MLHFSTYEMTEQIAEISNGLKLAYKVTGDLSKPVIALLNGSVFNYKQYDYIFFPELQNLLGDEFSYLQYDYVGIGNSSPLEGEFDFVAIADRFTELLDALGIEKVHLFGFSKGSIIGQITAAKYPDRVLSFAGYGNPNLHPDFFEHTNEEFGRRLQFLQSITGLWSEKINEQNFEIVYDSAFLPNLGFSSHSIKDISFIEKKKYSVIKKRTKDMLMGTPIESISKLYEYYRRTISEEETDRYVQGIQSIKTPVLLIHGIEDEVIPIEASRRLHEWIKHSVLVEVDGFNHANPLLTTKQGKKIMAEYARFLKNLYNED